jgi:hypothetical protein
MTEHDFQKNIVHTLQMQNIFVFAVPNSQKLLQTKNQFMRMKFLSKQKAEGFLAGVADLIVLLPRGKTIFLELKNPDTPSPQSDTQKKFQANVEKLGFEYWLIKSWAEFEKFFGRVIMLQKINSCSGKYLL